MVIGDNQTLGIDDETAAKGYGFLVVFYVDGNYGLFFGEYLFGYLGLRKTGHE